jgi:hypothetical protein
MQGESKSPTVPPSRPAWQAQGQGRAKRGRARGTPGQRYPDSESNRTEKSKSPTATPPRKNATSSDSEDEEQEEQEGDELPSPELSDTEDEPEEASASKEIPKEAAAPAGERKEEPSYSPPDTPPEFHNSSNNEPENANVLSPDHDSDIEELKPEETLEQRKQRAFAHATAENMPLNSTQLERKDWPYVWLHEWERRENLKEEAAEKATRDAKRSNKHYQEEVKAARETLEYATNFTWIMGTEAEKNITKQFTKLWFKYAIDKIDLPDSQQRDPWGADVSTPELRHQAWTSRVQAIANARDLLKDVNKHGFFQGARPKQIGR